MYQVATFFHLHTLSGPTVPDSATNIESTVTSFSTVTISWSVPRVAYTPETYTVVYGTNKLNLDQRSTTTSGVSGTTHYSTELTQLQHSTLYYFWVESTNTIGSTNSETRPFEVQNTCKQAPLSLFPALPLSILCTCASCASQARLFLS